MRFIFRFLLLVIIAAAGYGYYAMQPVKPMGEEKRVEISTGTTRSGIAKILEIEGIIRDKLVFQAYLIYYKKGNKFQAGAYSLSPSMTFDEIIEKLESGDVIRDTVVFTIPEGSRIEQIKEILKEKSLGDPDKFLDLVNQPLFFNLDILKDLEKQTTAMKYLLEGYLFPETYEVRKDANEEQIIEKILKELEKKINTLPQGWQEEMKKQKLDLHQLLTVASLVEREVVVPEERARVAGVIYNRLEKQIPLQIDATVQYLYDQPKERLLYSDLRIASPYNTYLNKGLPPGPIASPSFESIQASLYPEKHEFFYYVTKKDGTKSHLFAKDYQTHLKNIEESKKTK